MIRRATAPAAAMLLAALAALCAPALALGSSGGVSVSASGSGPSGQGAGTGSSGSSTNPLVRPGNVTVSASGSGVTVSTIASALLRSQLQFSGTAPASDSGATVEIERLGHETNWTWQPTAQATINPDGSFSATWTTNHIGQFAIRAVLATAGAQAAVATAGAQPGATAGAQPGATSAMSITVFRPSVATWYGPGFFGHRTACGVRLGRHTLGVANRSLPCGTEVALYYNGQMLTVPVIDRGPYANHADWDLTQATSQALGLTGTATLGAVSLPSQPSQPSRVSRAG